MSVDQPDSAGRPDFRILHVCTGNICRSPMAELLTRDGLALRLGAQARRFAVSSAGTWGHAGAAMESSAARALAGYRLDGSEFRARELDARHVELADLVLTATREHRSAAVVLHPRASSRTFTLREFARLTSLVVPEDLVDQDPVERAKALVRMAAGNRGLVPPDSPDDDDLEDPYHAPDSAFRACARLIEASMRRPLDLLVGPGRPQA